MSTGKQIKELGKDTLVYGLSATVTRFIGIFLVPLYTRVFLPADYGIIAMITAFYGLITTFVVLGMDNASARWFYSFTQDDIGNRKRVISTWFWFQGLVSVLTAVIICLFSAELAKKMLDSQELAGLLFLVGLSIPLNTPPKVVNNWLRYQRRAWNAMTISLVTSLITIGLTILFVLVLRWGLPGVYWAQLLGLAGIVVVDIALLKSWIAPRYISPGMLKEMLVFALPLVPASIAAWVTASADRFILKSYVTTSQIGLYSIAATLASAVGLATVAFQMAWGPFAYSILDQSNARDVYSKVLSLYSLVGCAMVTGLTLFTPLILKIFTTSAYAGAASSVAWLAFSTLSVGGTYIASLGCGIVKKSVPLSISVFIGAGVNTALNFILIPRLGKDGAAIATMLAYMLATAYLFYIGQKYYPIPYRFQDVLICLGFAWLLIGLNQYLLPGQGIGSFIARVGMCLLFIPLALLLKIVKVENIKSLSIALVRRLGWNF